MRKCAVFELGTNAAAAPDDSPHGMDQRQWNKSGSSRIDKQGRSGGYFIDELGDEAYQSE